jgi:serine protease Do
MKRYTFSAIMLATGISLSLSTVSAQQRRFKSTLNESDSSNQIIIDTKKNGKKSTLVIELGNNEVKVNGKPLAEFKDDNITIRKGNKIIMNWSGENPFAFNFPQGSFRNFENLDFFSDNGNHSWNQEDEDRAYLGVMTETHGDGARITEVMEKTPAEKAGLKKGDIITSVNEKPISNPEELSNIVGTYKPEDKVNIALKRDGRNEKISLTLGKRKSVGTFSFGGPRQHNLEAQERRNSEMELRNRLRGMFDRAPRPRLGIKAQETEEGKGVKILNVEPDSPAQKAGLKEGDVIMEVDGHATNEVDELADAVSDAAEKRNYTIKYTREGKAMEASINIPKKLKSANL